MREWRLYLDDMCAACEKVTRYTDGMSLSDLQADERTYDAVIRNLEVIGEAAKFVPEDVRQRAPDIGWVKIVALRNVIAHVYFRGLMTPSCGTSCGTKCLG